MRIIETKAYKFEELSNDAKQKAIERLWDINVDYGWWENMYEDSERIGLKITSFDLDRNRHCKGQFMYSAAEVAANIIRDHGDMCETYKTAQNFLGEYNPIFAEYMDENSDNYESRELEEKMQDIEEEFLNGLLEDYAILLQKEYEYLTSEEAIREAVNAIGREFTEEGNLI